MLRGAPPYTPCVYTPSAGMVPVTGLSGFNVTDAEHEHGLPGGPMRGGFTVHGPWAAPLGAPVVHYSGGVPVFTGSVDSFETVGTGRARQTMVEVAGSVKHMQEDDSYSRFAVHGDLTAYADQRTMPGAQLGLAKCFASGVVAARAGELALITGNGVALTAGGVVAATLDLGPGAVAARIIVTYTSSNNTGNQYIAVGCTATPDIYGTGAGGAVSVLNNAAASGTMRATIGTVVAARYVHIYMGNNVGYTPAADVWFRIQSIKVFVSSGYESGDVSILTGDVVMKDVLGAGITPQISTDTTRIAALPTALSHFVSDGPISPYDLFESANAVDQYQWYLDPSTALPVAVARATPTGVHWTAPPGTYKMGNGSGYAQSDIYNKVRIRWREANGTEHLDTVTGSSDILTRAGKTRTATIEVTRPTTSTEATAVANAFLAAYANPSLRGGSVILHQGIVIGRDSGVEVPAARLFVGDRLELPGERAPGSTPGYRGLIQNVKWTQDAGTAEVVLENDRMAWDRMFQRFQAGVPWGKVAGRL